jgi:hypothetical protein
MSVYSIGDVYFDDLTGDVVLPTPHNEVESHAGQDGVTVFASGKRGRDFYLESVFHETSWANANTLQLFYYAAPGLAPLNIVRGTETYALTAFRFIVLDVHVSIEPVIAWTGLRVIASVLTRLNIAPAFAVKARWHLVAIDTSLVIGGPPPPEEDPPPPI